MGNFVGALFLDYVLSWLLLLRIPLDTYNKDPLLDSGRERRRAILVRYLQSILHKKRSILKEKILS